MAGQFLTPAGLAIADRWPLAYVRGNHDVRGPAAHALPDFTGTPDDRYYYGFRSGPLAALVMDTGEDKPDDSPYFGGMARVSEDAAAAGRVAQGRRRKSRGSATRRTRCSSATSRSGSRATSFPTHRRWECHNVCRELWVPTLVEAGVKLVVSGHTHDYRWMPAKEGQPIAQLIGGAPQPQSRDLHPRHRHARHAHAENEQARWHHHRGRDA